MGRVRTPRRTDARGHDDRHLLARVRGADAQVRARPGPVWFRGHLTSPSRRRSARRSCSPGAIFHLERPGFRRGPSRRLVLASIAVNYSVMCTLSFALFRASLRLCALPGRRREMFGSVLCTVAELYESTALQSFGGILLSSGSKTLAGRRHRFLRHTQPQISEQSSYAAI